MLISIGNPPIVDINFVHPRSGSRTNQDRLKLIKSLCVFCANILNIRCSWRKCNILICQTNRILLSTLSTPSTSHRTIQIVQTMLGRGCEKRNSLLKWSATGSLPLISTATSEDYRKALEVCNIFYRKSNDP